MSNLLDNFLGGFALGTLANNPFFRGCFGFGMFPMYGSFNFCGFANGFPSIFPPMGMMNSSMNGSIMPETFANPGFPAADFSGACQTIWDNYTNPDSQYNKQLRESFSQMQSPSSPFFMPSANMNSWFTGFPWSFPPAKTNSEVTTYTNSSDDKRFNKFLSIILDREGGYSNNSSDKGGETNKGITHTTYDEYRTSKGLSKRSVKEMTNDEMREIYYERYYKASGADKISDKKLALYVFDTAVNMGVSRAKELFKACGGDRTKFEQLRKNKYDSIIANDSSQKVFRNGWNNRMSAIKKAADNELDTIA